MDVMPLLSNREQMTAAIALILYAGPEHVRATVNPVYHSPEGPRLGAGEALTHENLEQISMALSGGALRRGVMPSRILYAEHGLLAWWSRSIRRPIFFSSKTPIDALNGQSVLHPPLMFVGRPGRLTVYALAEDARPTDETPLCRAPYFNLYGHGAMCDGNVPVPQNALPSSIEGYERAFYDSDFVHSNLGGKDLCAHPQGHGGYWRAMAKPRARFRPEWLQPVVQGDRQMTVLDALNIEVSR